MYYFTLKKPEKISHKFKHQRMMHAVILHDGKNYLAMATFRPTVNGRVDCYGWKMLGKTADILKEMLEDIATIYPPQRDIEVNIRECSKLP